MSVYPTVDGVKFGTLFKILSASYLHFKETLPFILNK